MLQNSVSKSKQKSDRTSKNEDSLSGFVPDWIGKFYARSQWQKNISSSNLFPILPLDFVNVSYASLHDLDFAVEKCVQETRHSVLVFCNFPESVFVGFELLVGFLLSQFQKIFWQYHFYRRIFESIIFIS